jgi:GNAT superfamily N-acetyltransferase
MDSSQEELKVTCSEICVDLPLDNQQYAVFTSISQFGDVVGVAKVSPWSGMSGKNYRPFLSGLYVRLGWRRMGIARDLVRYIERRCIILGYPSLALYVNRQNLPSQKLFESEGYRPMLDDDDNIMFVKFLGPLGA